MCEASAEPWLLETRPQPVDHFTRRAIFLLRLFLLLGFSIQASGGGMGLPEWRWVANRLGECHCLPQPALGFVSLLAGKGDFSLQPPPLDQVFPGIGTCGTLQTLRDVLLCFGEVAAGEPEVPQAGQEMHGIAPLHPVTRGWIMRQAVDPVQVFLGQPEVALY